MKKIVSLIPARGGSKGVKNKNIIDLNGKPLISYSINASLESLSKETWVSTDSDDIAKISKSYGANVIKRPNNISLDTSKSEEALNHFLEKVDFDILVFIQCTSPLINSKDINKGIKLIIDDKYDSVFSVCKEHWIPRWTLDIEPINWDPKNRPRRQEKNDVYLENGAFYITTKEQLQKSTLRYGGNISIVEMPLSRSFQVDTIEDLNLIRNITKNYNI